MSARITIGLLLISVSMPAAVLMDRIAVTVGKDAITEGEVLEELRITDFLNGDTLDLSAAARRAAAERLVDQELIRQEMSIAHTSAPEESQAEQMLENVRKSHFASADAFQAALKRYGITAGQVKKHLLWQLAALRFTDLRFQPGTLVTSEQLRGQLERKAAARSKIQARTPPPSPNSRSRARVKPQATAADHAVPPPANVDDQLEAWLKDARSQTSVVFKKEAFE